MLPNPMGVSATGYIYAVFKRVVKLIGTPSGKIHRFHRSRRYCRMTFQINTKSRSTVTIKGKDFRQKSVCCIALPSKLKMEISVSTGGGDSRRQSDKSN